jgi:hypothetical protein
LAGVLLAEEIVLAEEVDLVEAAGDDTDERARVAQGR